MRRYHFALMTATVSALTLGLLLTGCGKKKDDEEEDLPPKTSKKSGGTGGSKAALRKPVSAKDGYDSVIRGKITWEGDPPDLKDLTAKLRGQMQTNRDYCLMGKEYEKTQQGYRIGENKGLGNVFVWIVPEAGHYFEIPKDQLAKVKKKVLLSQPHCAFLPHCTVLFPTYYDPTAKQDDKQVPTGQVLEVENNATVQHNSNFDAQRNPKINFSLPPGRRDPYPPKDKEGHDVPLKIEAGPIMVSCNIHGWMRGYLRAFDHPYAAVTGTGGNVDKKEYEDLKSDKFGTYEITGVPVGAKVRIIAWHEDLQYLDGNKGRELEVKKGNNDVDFTAKAK